MDHTLYSEVKYLPNPNLLFGKVVFIGCRVGARITRVPVLVGWFQKCIIYLTKSKYVYAFYARVFYSCS